MLDLYKLNLIYLDRFLNTSLHDTIKLVPTIQIQKQFLLRVFLSCKKSVLMKEKESA
jgi:hypothetical protein